MQNRKECIWKICACLSPLVILSKSECPDNFLLVEKLSMLLF
jgi:hypothetical protein